MIGEAQITSIFGKRRCGKSALTRILADAHPRLVIFDYTKEWRLDGARFVSSFEEFCNVWKEEFYKPSFSIIVRFPFRIDMEQMQEIAGNICELMYRTGQDTSQRVCLVFEECHFYFPSNSLHPVFLSLLTTGRHAHLDLICNSQRPASVHKLLISQSEELYIGNLYEVNDIKYLRDTIGDDAYLARQLTYDHFLYYKAGEFDSMKVISINPNSPKPNFTNQILEDDSLESPDSEDSQT